ncbi:MBL fold metallo-hydrolase [Streptomyces platensis]|uniref:MBL fold metallo-hydrolase n=1 Tax=Streptomyces platensis TaxID=58346 RepID=UPI003C2E2240
MRLTKFTHSCVRLERPGGGTLVIDPGIWSEARALHGADAILVTHEHADHVDVLRLKGLGAPVYAPKGADFGGLLDVIEVEPDEEFSAAGFHVTAHGGRHARIYGDLPDCAHLGYLIDERLYHPGDSLHVPDRPVETLFVPVQASWLRTSEAIDFVRAVKPERAYGIHDAQINERGLHSVNGWLGEEAGGCYRWVPPGASVPGPER